MLKEKKNLEIEKKRYYLILNNQIFSFSFIYYYFYYYFQTLSKLAQFSNNLKKAKSESSTNDNQTTTIYSETYTGQVLEKDDDEMIDTKGWHLGKLKFRKHIDDLYRMGGDGRSLDDYKVEDSRITNR